MAILNFLRYATLSLAFLVAASPASAAILLQLGQAGNIGTPVLSGTSGGTVKVQFYLTQTGDFAGSADTRLNDIGVGSFNFAFDLARTDGISFGGAGTFEFASGLDFNTLEDTSNPASAVYAASSELAPGGFDFLPVTLASGINSILVGTASLDLSSMASGTYGLTLTPEAFGGVTLGPNPLNFVAATPATANLEVVAVPEPTSFAAVTGLALVVATRRRRRKR
ncbi:MAG: PEP-CTERM sorting domain-containing protein [Rubripirellula sp.]